jgi:hypothetical protein
MNSNWNTEGSIPNTNSKNKSYLLNKLFLSSVQTHSFMWIHKTVLKRQEKAVFKANFLAPPWGESLRRPCLVSGVPGGMDPNARHFVIIGNVS